MTELRERLSVDDVELAWDRWGDAIGTPLVLCHGFTGCAHDFALSIPALAQRRPVLAVDHRGHGSSTKTHNASGYTVARLTADLVAWLEATAGGPVDLLGHSMGGRLAMWLTVQRPDLVRSLILMDTSATSFVPDNATREMTRAFLGRFDPTRGLPNLVELGRGPEQALIDATTPDDWRAEMDRLRADFDPWAFQSLGLELSDDTDTSLLEHLGETTCPVTVIVGSLDHPLSEQAPQLTGVFAHGEMVVIDGAYHSPQLTHPGPWLAAVEAHLARVNDQS